MKKRFIIIVGFILLLFSCRTDQQLQPTVEKRIMMGTMVQISVYNNPPEVEQIIEEAFNAIAQVNQIASNYIDSSVVSVINREAAKHDVKIDSNLFDLIKQAQWVSEISDGAFDITIVPLLKLWDYNDPEPELPTQSEIKAALELVDYRNISLNVNGIKFNKSGMKIDLGGIAKGYAVDKAMDVLNKRGIKDALVDAGGDFRAISSDLTKGKRKVWIKHPRQKDRLFGYFKMDNGSVATSGDYERFFFVDSVRYHHIINPKTGYPANECISVTIQTKNAVMADALATAVFLIGPTKGMKLVNQLENVEAVIITEENNKLQYIVSEGLKGKFFKS